MICDDCGFNDDCGSTGWMKQYCYLEEVGYLPTDGDDKK
jgi:hypothetical protein